MPGSRLQRILIPGRHVAHTTFQASFLRLILGRPVQPGWFRFPSGRLGHLPAGSAPPVGVLSDVVFAITSANMSGSSYNPIPFEMRLLGCDRFSTMLRAIPGVRSVRAYGIPHLRHAPSTKFAEFVIKEVEAASGGRVACDPETTAVLCCTPEVAAQYTELGYLVLPAEAVLHEAVPLPLPDTGAGLLSGDDSPLQLALATAAAPATPADVISRLVSAAQAETTRQLGAVDPLGNRPVTVVGGSALSAPLAVQPTPAASAGAHTTAAPLKVACPSTPPPTAAASGSQVARDAFAAAVATPGGTLPEDEILRVVVTDPVIRQIASQATVGLWRDYPEVASGAVRLFTDPVLKHGGGLTDTRDYATYATAMSAPVVLELKWADLRPDVVEGRIADEGTADGGMLVLAARDFPDSDLLGVDLAAQFIERCRQRQRAGHFGASFVHFTQRNLLFPVFRDASIDTTLCNSTTHELWSYAAGQASLQLYLSLKARQLRRGGRLLCRDVTAPLRQHRDTLVLLWLRDDDGAGPGASGGGRVGPFDDLVAPASSTTAPPHADETSPPGKRPRGRHTSPLDDQSLSAHLLRLSTADRFVRFARDFLHNRRPVPGNAAASGSHDSAASAGKLVRAGSRLGATIVTAAADAIARASPTPTPALAAAAGAARLLANGEASFAPSPNDAAAVRYLELGPGAHPARLRRKAAAATAAAGRDDGAAAPAPGAALAGAAVGTAAPELPCAVAPDRLPALIDAAQAAECAATSAEVEASSGAVDSSGRVFLVRLGDAMEYLAKHTYTENWDAELHEQFCYFDVQQWSHHLQLSGLTMCGQRADASAAPMQSRSEPDGAAVAPVPEQAQAGTAASEGAVSVTGTRAYCNPWLVRHRFAPCAAISAVPLGLLGELDLLDCGEADGAEAGDGLVRAEDGLARRTLKRGADGTDVSSGGRLREVLRWRGAPWEPQEAGLGTDPVLSERAKDVQMWLSGAKRLQWPETNVVVVAEKQ